MDLTTDLAILRERPDLFQWGQVVKIHTVGEYAVVEFRERPVLNFQPKKLFAPYYQGQPLEGKCSFRAESLEAALLLAFGHKFLGAPAKAVPAALTLGIRL